VHDFGSISIHIILITGALQMSRKQVKIFGHTTPTKDFYFSIVGYVKEHNRLPTHWGSKQKLNYYVYRLKQQGILIKKGYGVWEVLEEVKQVKHTTPGSPHLAEQNLSLNSSSELYNIKGFDISYAVRGHGFFFELPLKSISSWHKRQNYMDLKGIKYKTACWGQTIDINDFKVSLYANKLLIMSPADKYYSENTALECKKKAVYDASQIMITLSNLFGIDFSSQGKYHFQIVKQHYAEVGNELAQEYEKKKDMLQIADAYKKVWLIVDKSTGIIELETIYAPTSLNDMDKVIKPFFNDLREHYQKTGESIRMSDFLTIQYNHLKEYHGIDIKNPLSLDMEQQDLNKQRKLPEYIG